ncbi:Maf family protein [Brevibacillus humidisoli]|uniref:Maf family protein n=1 Tax=Brevibacillus humidisoli TaxID=2895522 RepID=UPI001E467D1A|nr:Maf family protein [Brevibacillus humidisoli]UFJ39057.1 Maf family protein [Brevibacillus humidisoli]
MQSTITLTLASASPRRRELLSSLGLPFQVQESHVDEQISTDLAPETIVETLSLGKAQAVAGKVGSGLVIGSDTIVVLDGEVLGKPRDEADALRMLSSLQGEEHTVYTGVAVIDAGSGRTELAHSATKVKMRPLTEREIRAYIATGEPMDKAGSYAIQGIGATIVERIAGDYFTVVGLPLHLTSQLLSRFGVSVLK